MLCSSVVRLKRKGNYFKWFEIIIYTLVLSLTFQLKANNCVWSNFVYLFSCFLHRLFIGRVYFKWIEIYFHEIDYYFNDSILADKMHFL